MKRITYVFLTLLLAFAGWYSRGQAVNEPANWPNSNWTLNVITHTGSNAMDIEADPTASANFAYDDDDTGSGSHDVIAAESPVIDISAAPAAGENFLVISGDYVYNNIDSDEYLAIEYWDADANNWVLWYEFPDQDTQGAPLDNYCSGTPAHYFANLDISSFTATQLSGFKYRIIYNDDITGGNGYNWGFCFSSPEIHSAATVYTNPVFTLTAVPDCNNSQFSVNVEVTDLGGAPSVTVSDDQGSPSQQLTTTGTVTFGPYAQGTNVTFTVTNDADNSYSSTDNIQYYCPPANDDCANAINLTVYPHGGGAGNETSATSLGASDSGQHPSCDNSGTNLDIWYSFTAPANGSVQVITGGTAGSQIEAAIWDTCGGTEIACQNNSSNKIFSGLTPGNTYILQVWHDDFNAGDFTIVLEEGPNSPANDDCANAINLTVYPNGGGAGNETSATSLGASDSGQHPSCDNTGTNLDLWYSFTAPANGSVQVITGGATGSNIEAAIWDTCGGTEIACQNNSSNKIFTGLTPGNTYILQVWHDDSNAGDFTIVLEEAPNPPANDNCSGAIALTVTQSCTPTTATNVGATDSGVAAPGCSYYQGGDVWFSVVVPSDGNVTIETSEISGSSVTDTGLAVYEGSCGSLTEIACNDDIGGGSLFSKVDLTGRTAGETLYVRVFEYGNDSYGDFGICAYNPNVAIHDLSAQDFSFYPNPATNSISWNANGQVEKVQITNLAGQTVLDVQNPAVNTLNIAKLTKGVYILHVMMDGKQGTYKLVKE